MKATSYEFGSCIFLHGTIMGISTIMKLNPFVQNTILSGYADTKMEIKFMQCDFYRLTLFYSLSLWVDGVCFACDCQIFFSGYLLPSIVVGIRKNV